MNLDIVVRLSSGIGIVSLLGFQIYRVYTKANVVSEDEYKLTYEQREQKSASRGRMRALKFISFIFLCVIFLQGGDLAETYHFILFPFLVVGPILFFRLSSAMSN